MSLSSGDKLPVVLTIAGTDPSGGAGIQVTQYLPAVVSDNKFHPRLI